MDNQLTSRVNALSRGDLHMLHAYLFPLESGKEALGARRRKLLSFSGMVKDILESGREKDINDWMNDWC